MLDLEDILNEKIVCFVDDKSNQVIIKTNNEELKPYISNFIELAIKCGADDIEVTQKKHKAYMPPYSITVSDEYINKDVLEILLGKEII